MVEKKQYAEENSWQSFVTKIVTQDNQVDFNQVIAHGDEKAYV